LTDNLLAEWARLVFGTLQAAGVRDVVVSPGSRSTPFAFAALNTPGLDCYSVWDERSAGFFALGQARVTGRPSALLCTSGSALSNYHPAVVEASYAHVPLLVLSADRPFELQDVGAGQCMDQVKLFGGLARRFFELGHPDSSDAALDSVERLVSRAVEHALSPAPGPVHVNLRAKKPLEPKPAATAAERALERNVRERLRRGPGRVLSAARTPRSDCAGELCRAFREHERGLIVLGPLPAWTAPDAEAVLELSRKTGYPVCAEATSQLRFATPESGALVGALDALLSFEALRPDFVIQFGGTPTSGVYERVVRETAVVRAVVVEHGFADPSNRARFLIEAEPWSFALLLAKAATASESLGRSEFSEAWKRADAAYFRRLDAIEREPQSELGEATAVRAALDALPKHALLGVGNSLPIRDVDAFVAPRAGALRVWSQRGLNGIDGLVSGASGAAQASGLPSLCLVGDVSFFHDLGGLALAAQLAQPLALVVLDNGGGRIFEHLPLAKLLAERPDLARFWTTPQSFDLRHAAALFELAYEAPETAEAVNRAVSAALSRNACTLIRVRVAPDSARATTARLREELAAELS
jgi:2-succinyl-5-enolpyruvyl-6-hydroxy-3-cyclohexene-1-carboxylate synthase